MSDGSLWHTTAGGIKVRRTTEILMYEGAIEPVVDALDDHVGVLLASSFDYPGRYSRWDVGFVDPPLELRGQGRTFQLIARNIRGQVLLDALAGPLTDLLADHLGNGLQRSYGELAGEIVTVPGGFPEEERSRQPSVFSVLRAIAAVLRSDEDSHLGLYGSFGYDLVFQFETLEMRHARPEDQPDLVLFLPDDLVVVDHQRHVATRLTYDFSYDPVAGRSGGGDRAPAVGMPVTSVGTVGNGDGASGNPSSTRGGERPSSTEGLPRKSPGVPYVGSDGVDTRRDTEPGGFAQLVRRAKESFARGDLFEVVPGQSFFEPCPTSPSEVFRRLRTRNPAPFGCLMNLGRGEYLVGASPEMYVRVTGSRVESCPISGTIARGTDVIEDAERILELLNSAKDAAELTMCTDVDRNDKARICVPGSVRVIGRRQIEMYSRLIHTVDHVEGELRPEFDALDAFLTHAWAVTVTGAPKLWAMRFIEEHERTPRRWYGGAIGCLTFDGNLNTGLTLRTVRIADGVAEVRAGATLLMDSDPASEEAETELKVSALLDALRRPDPEPAAIPGAVAGGTSASASMGDAASLAPDERRVLLLDHEDSFVHTLADYLRQVGATVTTVRIPAGGRAPDEVRRHLEAVRPDLVVLSPGPGRPEDFHMDESLGVLVESGVALFGVCLGMQGIVEHFGGTLDQLPYPVHGKASTVSVLGGCLFGDVPAEFLAGRYHSLFASRSTLPEDLVVTAESDDGVVMAVEHRHLPIAGVQFHPESVMTMRGEVGLQIVANALAHLVTEQA